MGQLNRHMNWSNYLLVGESVEQQDISEKIQEQGEELLNLTCEVDSPAGSGFSKVLRWERKFYVLNDWDGLSKPFESFDTAAAHLPLAIHTDGAWTLAGPMAETVLPGVEVYNLNRGDPPFIVIVNKRIWTVQMGETPNAIIWTGPLDGPAG
jgi:hypothetical protein